MQWKVINSLLVAGTFDEGEAVSNLDCWPVCIDSDRWGGAPAAKEEIQGYIYHD